jgi:D-alanine-D-alanine ligase
MLAQGKDLSKTLVRHHRVPAPAFHVFPIGRKVKRPKRLKFPLIVKSLTEDASLGISQASVVDSDEKLAERVAFIHERIQTAAIAEEYIDGREIYVGVYGNGRLRALPLWELRFDKLAPGALPIATERAKFNPQYQERRGVEQGRAKDIPEPLETRIANISKRICSILEIDGYARIDFRLSQDNVPYFIEANPNPEIAAGEEFAQAALHDGLDYPSLLHRILTLGIKRAGLEAEED